MSSDLDWRKLKTIFTVYEAANTILGITQPEQENDYQIESVCRELMNSMQAGELEYEPCKQYGKRGNYLIVGGIHGMDGIDKDEGPIPVGMYWRAATIAREDLAAWCEMRNCRPSFLFPDPPADKPLHESERKTLYLIIRTLAKLHGVKPIPTREDGDGWHKAAESLLEEFSKKGIDPPSGVVALRKHLRAAFSNGDS